MKTVSPALQAHLDQDTTTLATCWKVTRRDGRVFRFTDHDQDLTVSGETYKASTGFARTAIESEAGYSVDNLDIDALFDSEDITETDLRAGKFDYAECLVFAVNWMDPTMGTIILRRGWIGEVQITQRGLFSTELRGLAQPLNRNFGEVYTPLCRADFGDLRCKVKIIKGPRWPLTGYSVGDYLAYFDAENGFTGVREVTVAGVTSEYLPGDPGYNHLETPDGNLESVPVTFSDHWFMGRVNGNPANARTFAFTKYLSSDKDPTLYKGGVLYFVHGQNLHFGAEVKSITADSLTLFLALPYVPRHNDTFLIIAGCDKRRATCRIFDNVINFRGEPDLPGQDQILQYPDGR